jgi:hypothetical protein
MIRVLLLCLFISIFYHDLHYSRSKVIYNTESKTLQTCINVFTDDLELAVNKHNLKDFEIGRSPEQQVDSLIRNYCLEHFRLSTSTKGLMWDWIGFECEYEITYLYIESEPFDIDSTLIVDIDLFEEMYDDQENVLDLIIQ